MRTGAVAPGGLVCAPAWFRAELVSRFGSGHDCEWDPQFQRWVIISPAASGRPTRQLVVWTRSPITGEPIKPDANGILPFRDLNEDTCWEILRNMEASALTNRHDGEQNWARRAQVVDAHNAKVTATSVRESAKDYADMISEVDLRRPWLKHHAGTRGMRNVAQRGR